MRIFVAPAALVAGELVVRGDEHHYLSHVRRVRVGDAVELVDGAGRRAAATIAAITGDATTLQAGAVEAIASAPPWLRALVPLIKGDRMDSCIEKLVEVGVDAIVVWPAARSVVRLDASRRDARVAKYQDAARAAARQSGRARVPEVTAGEDLAAVLAGLPEAAGGLRLVLDPTSDASLAEALAAGASTDGHPLPASVTLASGPEGGLTPGELAQLERASFQAVGLGPRVLRAETAPVVAVAVVRALTGS